MRLNTGNMKYNEKIFLFWDSSVAKNVKRSQQLSKTKVFSNMSVKFDNSGWFFIINTCFHNRIFQFVDVQVLTTHFNFKL